MISWPLEHLFSIKLLSFELHLLIYSDWNVYKIDKHKLPWSKLEVFSLFTNGQPTELNSESLRRAFIRVDWLASVCSTTRCMGLTAIASTHRPRESNQIKFQPLGIGATSVLDRQSGCANSVNVDPLFCPHSIDLQCFIDACTSCAKKLLTRVSTLHLLMQSVSCS